MKKRNLFFIITSIVISSWAILSVLLNTILNFDKFDLPKILYVPMVLLFRFGTSLEAYYGYLTFISIPIAVFAIIGCILMKDFKMSFRKTFCLLPVTAATLSVVYTIAVLTGFAFTFLMFSILIISTVCLACWLGLNIYALCQPGKTKN